MTIQFFIFTIYVSKRKKKRYTQSIEKYQSHEERLFDRKVDYYSQIF